MKQGQSPSAPQPGEIFADKYRVVRVLGAGGMGVVFAATHLDLGELRAIKLMLPEVRDNARALSRFLREARATARLRSEHVVKVHDVGRLPTGEPYMVMEHLEGQDLKSSLRSHGPLGVTLTVDFALQALEAIADAHAHGIVHRDLKPANLFLGSDRDGRPCIKILDFGISKVASAEASFEATSTSAILGSPYYMSPEQMRSTRDADARTDIWAMGVVLFELLLGRLPFVGESVMALCTSVLQDKPPLASSLRADVPPGLAAVIAHCLEKNRDDRYRSAAELAEALYPFGSGAEAASLDRIRRSASQQARVSQLDDGPGCDSQGTRTASRQEDAAQSAAPAAFALPAPAPLPTGAQRMAAPAAPLVARAPGALTATPSPTAAPPSHAASQPDAASPLLSVTLPLPLGARAVAQSPQNAAPPEVPPVAAPVAVVAVSSAVDLARSSALPEAPASPASPFPPAAGAAVAAVPGSATEASWGRTAGGAGEPPRKRSPAVLVGVGVALVGAVAVVSIFAASSGTTTPGATSEAPAAAVASPSAARSSHEPSAATVLPAPGPSPVASEVSPPPSSSASSAPAVPGSARPRAPQSTASVPHVAPPASTGARTSAVPPPPATTGKGFDDVFGRP